MKETRNQKIVRLFLEEKWSISALVFKFMGPDNCKVLIPLANYRDFNKDRSRVEDIIRKAMK